MPRPSVRISHAVTANGKKETQYEAIFLQVSGVLSFIFPMAGSRLMEVHPFVPCSHAREVRKPALVLRGVFAAETVRFLLSRVMPEGHLSLFGLTINRLRVFRIANTVRLGRGVGQERW
jgi:hypothetical protein